MAKSLFTMPIADPELRALKITSAKTKLSMAAIVRRGLSRVLPELSPDDAETWEALQTKRASRGRSVAA
jgi:hypothetical protein